MFDICFHQIRDNFKNLKFIISFLIILILFIINALFFSFKVEDRFAEYNSLRSEFVNSNGKLITNLNNVVFYEHLALKKPLKSEFIINGNQELSPDGQTLNVMSIDLPEQLYYQNRGMIKLPPIDWYFIIAVIISFLIFILTYDSISGEKEKGTFKIVFSNSISKLNFLLGKIAGISISIIIPVLIGIFLNIILILAINKIAIDTILILKIGVFILYSIFYILFIVTLGIFISFVSNNSLKALIFCSLLWIVFVVIIPVTMRIIITNGFKITTSSELALELKEADDRLVEFLSKHDAGARGVEAGKIDNYKKERGEAQALQDLAALKQKIKYSHLSEKIRQAELFYITSSISPVYLYQLLIENLFGTGLERDKDFYQQVINYQNQLENFYKNKDQSDETSPHVYFLSGYLSNDIKFKSSEIPQFHELGTSFGKSILNSSMVFVFMVVEYIVILGLLCTMFNRSVVI